jgi:hypothetical protein
MESVVASTFRKMESDLLIIPKLIFSAFGVVLCGSFEQSCQQRYEQKCVTFSEAVPSLIRQRELFSLLVNM